MKTGTPSGCAIVSSPPYQGGARGGLTECVQAVVPRQGAERQRRQAFRAFSRRARGMTLVEVMAAAAILFFGMVAIVALFTTAARTHAQAVNETRATLAATSILSEARGLFARGLVPAETPKKAIPEHPDFPPTWLVR